MVRHEEIRQLRPETERLLAVHYTHATATFTASFLLRLSRILWVLPLLAPSPCLHCELVSPEHCDQEKIRSLIDRLISVLYESTCLKSLHL